MKAFLEEYGLIVVVCIVIAVLIGLAVWAANTGKGSAEGTINTFTNKADTIVNEQLDQTINPAPNASEKPSE